MQPLPIDQFFAYLLDKVELALADTSPKTEAVVCLQEIRRAGWWARDLVQQILTFSQRQDSIQAATCVSALLHEAQAMLRTALPSEVELVVDEGRVLSAIWANGMQIEQVLLNRIANALQAVKGRSATKCASSLRRCEGRPRRGRGASGWRRLVRHRRVHSSERQR